MPALKRNIANCLATDMPDQYDPYAVTETAAEQPVAHESPAVSTSRWGMFAQGLAAGVVVAILYLIVAISADEIAC